MTALKNCYVSLLVLLTVFPLSGMAQSAASSPVVPVTSDGTSHLLWSWPEVPATALKRLIRSTPASTIQVPDDASLLTPLRQRLIPMRLEAMKSDPDACRSQETASSSPRPPGALQLLELASRALDFMRLEQAEALLLRVQNAIVCDPAPLTSSQVARFHFLMGVLEVFRTGTDGEHFSRALTVDSSLPFPSSYPPEVQSAFKAARPVKDADKLEAALLPEKDVIGLEVRVDGAAVKGGRLQLFPGAHSVQLVGQHGKAVCGRIVLVEEDGTQEIVVPPSDLIPPSEEAARALLQQAIWDRQLPPALLDATLEAMEVGGFSRLTLVSLMPDGKSVGGLELSWDGAVRPLLITGGDSTKSDAGERLVGKPASSPSAGQDEKARGVQELRLASGILAGVGVLAGGTSVYLTLKYDRGATLEEPQRGNIETVNTVSAATFYVSLAGAVGTGAVAYMRDRASRVGSRGQRMHLAVQATLTGLALEGRF